MRRDPVAVVLLTVFVDLLGFGIVLPILPFYAQRYGASPVQIGGSIVDSPTLGPIDVELSVSAKHRMAVGKHGDTR